MKFERGKSFDYGNKQINFGQNQNLNRRDNVYDIGYENYEFFELLANLKGDRI